MERLHTAYLCPVLTGQIGKARFLGYPAAGPSFRDTSVWCWCWRDLWSSLSGRPEAICSYLHLERGIPMHWRGGGAGSRLWRLESCRSLWELKLHRHLLSMQSCLCGGVRGLVPLLKVLDSFWFPNFCRKGFRLVPNQPQGQVCLLLDPCWHLPWCLRRTFENTYII